MFSPLLFTPVASLPAASAVACAACLSCLLIPFKFLYNRCHSRYQNDSNYNIRHEPAASPLALSILPIKIPGGQMRPAFALTAFVHRDYLSSQTLLNVFFLSLIDIQNLFRF